MKISILIVLVAVGISMSKKAIAQSLGDNLAAAEEVQQIEITKESAADAAMRQKITQLEATGQSKQFVDLSHESYFGNIYSVGSPGVSDESSCIKNLVPLLARVTAENGEPRLRGLQVTEITHRHRNLVDENKYTYKFQAKDSSGEVYIGLVSASPNSGIFTDNKTGAKHTWYSCETVAIPQGKMPIWHRFEIQDKNGKDVASIYN